MKKELDKVLSAMLRSRIASLAHGASYEAEVDALLAGETDPYRAAEKLLGES